MTYLVVDSDCFYYDNNFHHTLCLFTVAQREKSVFFLLNGCSYQVYNNLQLKI